MIKAKHIPKPIKDYPGLLRFRTHGVDHSGWSIRFGPSQFLVAYGSDWTTPIGRKLFNDLKWWRAK